MSERDNLDDQALQDLLRDRLPADEAAALREKIAADPALRAEFALQKALAAQGSAPFPFPGELGWHRLSKQLDEAGRAAAPGARPAAWRAVRTSRVTTWQAAAAAALMFVGGVAVTELAGNRAEPSGYELASETPGSTALLKVAFAPGASISDVQSLLRASRAEIVSGPSAVGLYDLRFASEDERDAAFDLYREMPDVIEEAARP